jgi:hypothetical protein
MENANESFIFLGYLLKFYKSLYIQYIENWIIWLLKNIIF